MIKSAILRGNLETGSKEFSGNASKNYNLSKYLKKL